MIKYLILEVRLGYLIIRKIYLLYVPNNSSLNILKSLALPTYKTIAIFPLTHMTLILKHHHGCP